MKIVFFGAGAMAEAIISGWTESPVLPPLSIYVTNKSDLDTLQRLRQTYGVELLQEHPEALEDADYIVLAMKPKDAAEAFLEIKNIVPQHVTVMSVIAGIDLETLSYAFPNHPVIRIMPNTSATIGKSASAMSATPLVTNESLQLVKQLFEAIGTVIVVPDDMMHAVTGVSGSGPAYIYYMTEILEEAAIRQGFSPETARQLVMQTLDGAVSMLKQTKEEPTTLRTRVTSPGGTTEAGIKQMALKGMEDAICSGVDFATKRSKVLGQAVKDSILPSRVNR